MNNTHETIPDLTETRQDLCRMILLHVKTQEQSSVKSVSDFIRPHVTTIDDGIYVGAFIEYLLGVIQARSRQKNIINSAMSEAIMTIMDKNKAEA